MANATDVLRPEGLIVLPYPPSVLVIPTFAARCLHARNDARDPSSERWNYVGDRVPEFCLNDEFHVIRDLLHAANLRHGTDGFTSPPKEGLLRIFFRPDGFGRV